MCAPMDGLAATIDGAIEVHLLEHLDVARFEVRDERKVGMLPIGVDAKSLETLALDADILFCPFAAQAANLGL